MITDGSWLRELRAIVNAVRGWLTEMESSFFASSAQLNNERHHANTPMKPAVTSTKAAHRRTTSTRANNSYIADRGYEQAALLKAIVQARSNDRMRI